MLNQTGKQLFHESAWKSLLHSETAAFDCFSVAGDGIWLSSVTASISWFFGVTLLECTCTHRAEVAKQFFLEDHPVLKMLGSSKVTDVLYRPVLGMSGKSGSWQFSVLRTNYRAASVESQK